MLTLSFDDNLEPGEAVRRLQPANAQKNLFASWMKKSACSRLRNEWNSYEYDNVMTVSTKEVITRQLTRFIRNNWFGISLIG